MTTLRTQEEAEKHAKEQITAAGGGEVRIQGRDGKWRDSDTMPSGDDPPSKRDTKH
ncbi:MAG TPA: DUF2188 domain-containing protein [Planctomycetota bacterium]|nr:DUF2188 domain-containing protein [Planctomycetota bacterium]